MLGTSCCPALDCRRSWAISASTSDGDHTLGRVGGGVQVLRPLNFVAGERAQPDAAALQVVDRKHGLEVAPPQAVDGGHHQDVALGKQLVQDVLLVAVVVVLGP